MKIHRKYSKIIDVRKINDSVVKQAQALKEEVPWRSLVKAVPLVVKNAAGLASVYALVLLILYLNADDCNAELQFFIFRDQEISKRR